MQAFKDLQSCWHDGGKTWKTEFDILFKPHR